MKTPALEIIQLQALVMRSVLVRPGLGCVPVFHVLENRWRFAIGSNLH